MTAILIHGLIAFMLVLFGAMAIAPLLLSGHAAARPDTLVEEDRVLHVSPVPLNDRAPFTAVSRPHPLGKAPSAPEPSRRDAA